MISGTLVDVSFPDLLQFLHLSGRSGTLYVERESETSYISFHNGRIASAWCPAARTVVDYLLEDGRLSADALTRARALHEREQARRTLGEILLSLTAITLADLRTAVARKIEQTVLELVGWRRGDFRFVVEEVRFDEELLFVPREVVAQADLDTQVVLMEALRLFDERGRESRPSLAAEASRAVAAAHERAQAQAVPTVAPTVAPAPEAPAPALATRIDVVTRDRALLARLGDTLDHLGPVVEAPWHETGMPAGQAPAMLVIHDLRNDPDAVASVARLSREHPQSAIVAVVADLDAAAAAYGAGAVAVVPADATVIAACCSRALQLTGRSVEASRDGLARLRGLLQDIRAGLAAPSLSVNLMAMVARSADRGILFAVRRDALVALTAFGRTADRVLLADATSRLRLVLETGGPFAMCFEEGSALIVDWEQDHVPAGMQMVVGCPASRQGVVFPVMGVRRVIAVLYADNGQLPAPLDDLEIIEIATGQFGLALENEILRRQVDR